MPRFVLQRSLYEVSPVRLSTDLNQQDTGSGTTIQNLLMDSFRHCEYSCGDSLSSGARHLGLRLLQLSSIRVRYEIQRLFLLTPCSVQTSQRQGLILLFCIEVFVFASSFAHMIIAALPDAQTAGATATLLFSMTMIFNG